ncbi:MAG: metallophosphoesterase [Actinomycetota bacterium]|nr:metallophosphoesterase [Actinomycetota bacterium]
MPGRRTRILHLSDLHVGTHDAPLAESGLANLIDRLDPELVIASGDLTHRGRPEQHERAAAFLKGLERPILTVPGNHDMPYTPIARFTRTFDEFERHWGATEQVYRSATLQVVGLNSARPWLQQSGRIRADQLAKASQLLDGAAPAALRVVVLHHHLLGAPWRSRKKPVARRSSVLGALVAAGAELVLAGHIHQAAISERHEFEVVSGEIRGVTVAIAPGLGQPRPNRRGEARGLLLYDCEDAALNVETYIWREDDWGLTAIRRFPRGRGPLATQSVPAAPPVSTSGP